MIVVKRMNRIIKMTNRKCTAIEKVAKVVSSLYRTLVIRFWKKNMEHADVQYHH
ncbi:hypothetical protein LissoIVSPER_00070 [Lissonota sp. PSUC_FEM 10030012]|nr:hypothetical protein [Lissonota sp. PSUC_FEM 10030012]